MDPMSPDTTAPLDAKALVAKVGEAEQEGKFQKLQALMDENGWTEDPGSLLLLAQKDDRTKGKSPDELADMISQDDSLYDDLVAYKPGGSLEKLAKDEPAELPKEDTSEEPSDDEMGSMLEGSASMKGEPMEKARGAMKSSGFKPGKDDMDYEKKKKFMSSMYEGE